MWRLTLAVALTLGCGSSSDSNKDKPAPPPPADCNAAVENALAMSKADLKKAIPSIDDAGIAKVKTASIARCNEDAWSAESKSCMAAAKTSDEVAKCEQKKTPEQRDKLLKAIAGAAGMTDPGSGSTDPGSGSESGSGSGSGGSAGSASGSGSAAK